MNIFSLIVQANRLQRDILRDINNSHGPPPKRRPVRAHRYSKPQPVERQNDGNSSS